MPSTAVEYGKPDVMDWCINWGDSIIIERGWSSFVQIIDFRLLSNNQFVYTYIRLFLIGSYSFYRNFKWIYEKFPWRKCINNVSCTMVAVLSPSWWAKIRWPWRDLYNTMTSSNGNIFRVRGLLCGEFPTQRPVTRSFDVFFDLRLNKRLSKQPWGWWFETPSWSLWRQCNDTFLS